MRRKLEARITDRTVEIVHAGKRVASHVRSGTRGGYTTMAERMPAAHQAHREWTPGRFLKWASDIGASTHQLVDHLLSHRPHPEMGYRSCLDCSRWPANTVLRGWRRRARGRWP